MKDLSTILSSLLEIVYFIDCFFKIYLLQRRKMVSLVDT
jgi:hypothetical protein